MDCKTVLLKDLNFNIPPIQRGLVWEPGQVINLWDSICKGYPIGSFLCYGKGELPDLLDGQQRYNAICMGFGNKMDKQSPSGKNGDDAESQSQAQIWVRRNPQNLEKPLFMVCTSCHPWGFIINGKGEVETLSHEEQAKANQAFLRSEKNDVQNSAEKEAVPTLDDLFVKASLKTGYPWYPREEKKNGENRWFVPLPLLLAHADKSASCVIKDWYDNQVYGHCLSLTEAESLPSAEGDRTLLGEIEQMLKSDWLKRIQQTEVPVITWDPCGQNLQELFERINKGGSAIKTSDLNYSSLCAYYADERAVDDSLPDLKEVHGELSKDFIPPESLAELAARLVKLEALEKEKAAYMPSSVVTVHDIRAWFTSNQGKPGLLGKRFLSLYRVKAGERRGAFASVVQKFKKWYGHPLQKGDKQDRLPASIFLFQNEHWLFVCIWTMMHFPDVFEWNNQTTARYFALFCMLPQMLVGSSRSAAFDDFARGFYEGIRGMDACSEPRPSLLILMAVGCAHASLNQRCCMHPYPWRDGLNDAGEWMSLLRESMKEESGGPLTAWRGIFTKYVYGDRTPNLFLHYYQRVYMNYMLEQSNFNPGMRAHWEKAGNRPWDLDHIIPDKWWLDRNDTRRNSMGNMQLLDFRANRSKGDRGITAPLVLASAQDDAREQLHYEFSKRCLRVWNGELGEKSEGDRMSIRNLKDGVVKDALEQFKAAQNKTGSNGFDGGVRKRADYIMETLLADLHLFDLLQAISSLRESSMSKFLNGNLKAAVLRYDFLNRLSYLLAEQSVGNIEWGVCRYQWATSLIHPMDNVPLCRPDEEMNFYYSLANQLHVGVRVAPVADSNTPELYFLCSNVYVNDGSCVYEYGLRRGMGVSLTDWRERYAKLKTQPGFRLELDDWWHKGTCGKSKSFVEFSALTPKPEEVCAALVGLRHELELAQHRRSDDI